MIDYFLSVPTESDMPEIPEGASVDVLGESETGIWQFNVRCSVPIVWPSNVTVHTPTTPTRVWFN